MRIENALLAVCAWPCQTTDRPLSLGERVGVRGYGLSIARHPSPCPSPNGRGDRRRRPREAAKAWDVVRWSVGQARSIRQGSAFGPVLTVSAWPSQTTGRPLSHGERVGVRGYGLSIARHPSPCPSPGREPLRRTTSVRLGRGDRRLRSCQALHARRAVR
jgi:hypothetical protein